MLSQQSRFFEVRSRRGETPPRPPVLGKEPVGLFHPGRDFPSDHVFRLVNLRGQKVLPSEGSEVVLGQDQASEEGGQTLLVASTTLLTSCKEYSLLMDCQPYKAAYPRRCNS